MKEGTRVKISSRCGGGIVIRTAAKDRAAAIVAANWRIRRRLPTITAYAKAIGFISGPSNEDIGDYSNIAVDNAIGETK